MLRLKDANKTGGITIEEFTGELQTKPTAERKVDDFCVLFLDVETTGVNYEADKIIQLALRPVFINRDSFHISKIAGKKVFYNDPGMKISQEITDLTGVTNEDVKDQEIDWSWLAGIIERVDFVICHNAKFDRNFVMRHLFDAELGEPSTVWACTFRQIQWKNVCKASSALEVLCVWHGFYYHAHDAGNDVDALIYLMQTSGRMGELLTTAQKSEWRVFAVNLPFEKKDEIKGRKYQWDNEVRMWAIGKRDKESADLEVTHLIENYGLEPQVFEIKPQYLFA